MAITACTQSNYANVNKISVARNDAAPFYSIPTPLWTEGDNTTEIAYQCNAVTLGGFRGLNS
jgi:hypothetical protein